MTCKSTCRHAETIQRTLNLLVAANSSRPTFDSIIDRSINVSFLIGCPLNTAVKRKAHARVYGNGGENVWRESVYYKTTAEAIR
jgi:hypothetical protein